MSYTVALLYVLIGLFDETSKIQVDTSALGAVNITSYTGSKGKCAVQYRPQGGNISSFVTVKPVNNFVVNKHYVGLRDNGPKEMNEYNTFVMPANYKNANEEFVLLNKTDSFSIVFESRDKRLSQIKIVSCDVSSCTCTVKL